MDQPTKPQQPRTAVLFGQNKAIAALTYQVKDGKREIGAIFHIPTRTEGDKTFFKALACSIEITEAQRIEILTMFGGIPNDGNSSETKPQGQAQAQAKG